MDRDRAGRIRSESPSAQPLVISDDPAFVDEMARLCAASALVADVVADPTRAGLLWARASCVLVDDERVADVAALRARRRDDVVVVGRRPPADEVWRCAVQIGAADVVVLPDTAGRIADRLAETASPGQSGGSVVGVVGAGGGAGASTVAAGLAAANARRGRRSLLIDADPLGGGIDLLLGCEGVPGLRWPDIEIDGGRVAAGSLLAALPSVGGVSVLSASAASGAELDAAVLHSMIEAGRRASRLVVVDLPRHADTFARTRSPDIDAILIVAATTVRSIASGRQVAAATARACSEVRVVVRTTRGRSIEPDAVAEALGVELAGIVPTLGAVTRAADDGDGVARGWRARRSYDLLLTEVAAFWTSR